MSELIAGVDEVGIGPIAGPVVAAAVILNPAKKIYKLRDSKILTAAQRDILYEKIKKDALCISIGIATSEEIDQLNIYHANLLAMSRAITSLTLTPQLILIDGRAKPPHIQIPMQAIVGGDKKIKCISAASIIAKVTRDRMMNHYTHEFPFHQFDKHKGYSTKLHRELVTLHGVTSIHRRSFTFIKKILGIEKET